MKSKKITINSFSITPLIVNEQSQIIFQRHCDYNRKDGGLIEDSVIRQQEIVNTFLNNLNIRDLDNTYFLFISSNTSGEKNFKRCVETTNIAMNLVKYFFNENNISLSHVINMNDLLNYKNSIHEAKSLSEPQMFIDNTGYLEYLKNKYGGINKEFWIDFESDLSKQKREELKAEGPDQIVERANKYIYLLQRYSNYFHQKNPNSKLIIWCGTHYDLISPLIKKDIFNFNKTDIVEVNYCGGFSFILNNENEIIANVNGFDYPVDFQYKKQLHRRF